METCFFMEETMKITKEISNQRIEWVDLVKGFATLCIIFGHIMEWTSSEIGIKLFLLPLVYSFSVPTFFFISGFLHSVKSIGFFQYMWKKVRAILLPYFTFAAIYILVAIFKKYILHSKDDINIIRNIKYFFIQEHYTVLWFLAVLFSVELIAFFICKIKSKSIIFSVSLLFVIVAFIYLKFVNKWLPWCTDEVIFATPIFLWGYLIKIFDKSDIFINIKFSPLYIVASIMLNVINLKINEDIFYVNMWKLHFGILPLFYLSALLAIFAMISIAKKIKTFSWLKYIGRNSLVYYGLHSILIAFFAHFIRKIFIDSSFIYLLICVSETILISVLMTIVNIIIIKTPLCVLIGKTYTKQAKRLSQ